MGEEIAEKLWEKALAKVHKSSICAKHGLIQCKIKDHAHLTKVKFSKIYKNVDPTCDRCHQAPASYAHKFWSCPALYPYWEEIFRKVTRTTIDLMQ